jgi:FKBP-type peptidyl-prolyl cis-trans isomerase 2
LAPSARRALALAALAALALGACRRVSAARGGTALLIRYELTVDGKVLESNFSGEPIRVVAGRGDVPPGVDDALEELGPGQEKTLTLPPERAFGAYDPKRVETTALSALGDVGRGLKAGQKIFGFRDGKPETALVTSVGGGNAVLDFNRPLAGKTVVYRVRVEAVEPR